MISPRIAGNFEKLEINNTSRVSAINFSVFGFILIADQLLLPMFHIGSFPYKISYILLGFWFLCLIINPGKVIKSSGSRSDFLKFSLLIIVIMVCSLLGEILVFTLFPVTSYAETFKSLITYILIVFSFGLGLSAPHFKYNWLIWVLFTSITLNFIFIFLKSSLPSFIIDIYYPEMVMKDFLAIGISDVDALLELNRPRGLFPNPNGSAFLVNIISLFICISLRRKLIPTPSSLVGIGIIMLPIILTILLASRGELLVAILLGVLNYKAIFKRTSLVKRLSLVLATILISASTVLYFVNSLGDDSTLSASLERIGTIVELVNNAEKDKGTYEGRTESIARPLLLVETAFERFIYSPLFGTGYTSAHKYPFDHPTENFHNDWFRLMVTSGLVGLFMMLLFIKRFALPISFLTLVPFILPGLVNTFLLNIPAVMFYFFMIGVITLRFRNLRQGVGELDRS